MEAHFGPRWCSTWRGVCPSRSVGPAPAALWLLRVTWRTVWWCCARTFPPRVPWTPAGAPRVQALAPAETLRRDTSRTGAQWTIYQRGTWGRSMEASGRTIWAWWQTLNTTLENFMPCLPAYISQRWLGACFIYNTLLWCRIQRSWCFESFGVNVYSLFTLCCLEPLTSLGIHGMWVMTPSLRRQMLFGFMEQVVTLIASLNSLCPLVLNKVYKVQCSNPLTPKNQKSFWFHYVVFGNTLQ